MTDSNPGTSGVNPRGIYKHAVGLYWEAGWRGILPLPVGQKANPPSGYTGYNGTDPSFADVTAWAEENPNSNIALRLPVGVVGIDVDAYAGKKGAESLRTLESELGTLPPTWTSTARTDDVSGIRLFRVPPGTRFREKFAGAGIDLLHHGHRYALVWPSTNPNADDAPYVWISPAGTRGIGVPVLAELPWLPSAWVGALRERDDGDAVALDRQATPAATAPVSSDPFAAPSRVFTVAQAQAFVLPDYEAFKAMRTPEDSGFNQALNDLAVLVSHFVPEFFSTEKAEAWLYEAAEHNRSVEFQGAHAVRTTIASGLGANTWKASRSREAESEGDAAGAALAPEPDVVDRLLAEMLDVDAVLALPPPVPLIRDVLDLDSESWIISKAGGFKSFVALDMACHVALGLAWRGRPVAQGPVVYVVAEGRKSIGQRLRAWIQTYEQRPKDLHVLPRPVQVRDGAGWAVLVEACRRLAPVLVILDTQARITVGLNENDNGEMGVLTEAVRRMKEATGACVLVVHHQGRSGEDGRGASAIDGAQDTELKVVRPDGVKRSDLTATLVMDKQKDAAEDIEFEFRMKVVDLGFADDGRALTSLALEPINADPFAVVAPAPLPDWEDRLRPNQADVLTAMRAASDESGATSADIRAWMKNICDLDNRPVMVRTSFHSAMRDLKRGGIVVQRGARYYLAELLNEEGD